MSDSDTNQTRQPILLSGGKLVKFSRFVSRKVASREIDVWLPPGYEVDGQRRYPVLYMQDGQNLFENEHAFAGHAWDIPGAVARGIAEGENQPVIVVGIWNSRQRIPEYMPRHPYDGIAKMAMRHRFRMKYGRAPMSDRYLDFLVTELKPFVDVQFRTMPGPATTIVGGSSMGGLLSMYAIAERPNVFGSAVCMSPSWTVGGESFVSYLRDRLRDGVSRQFYIDAGSELENAEYHALHTRVERILRESGYLEGKDWLSPTFPQHDHSEKSWGDRFGVPLSFLLEPETKEPAFARAASL